MLQGYHDYLCLYLHLTMDCNLRCKYCYSGEKTSDRMALAVGKRSVDFFLDRTDHLTLRFFGGEPLLEFKLLRDIVAYCNEQALEKRKKVDYVIVTNGTLFTREVSEFCKRHRIDYSISFDGSQQAQDANRVFLSGKGSFAAVEKNIPHMLRWNPFVHIVRVVSPNNMTVLTDSIRYFFKQGFRVISLSPDYTHAEFREYLPMMKREYYKLANTYVEYLERGQRVFLNVFSRKESAFNRGRCQMGQKDFSVDVFGNIYPCCCFADHKLYMLGNIHDGIESEKAEIFLEELNHLNKHIEEMHRDCPETSFCKSGCGCTNIVTSGIMSTVHPALCEYGKMEAEVRDYVNAKLAGLSNKDR